VQQAAAPAPATVATAAPAPAPAPASAAPAPAAGNARAAQLLTRVNPVYPSDAARNRQEGWVEVAFTVGADGRVKDASVVSATPPRIFNAAALRAVQGWTFQPRVENGKPAEQSIRTRIEFKL
jgi:protein TonB